MADYKDRGRAALREAVEEAIQYGGMSAQEIRDEVEYLLGEIEDGENTE